MHSGAEIVDRPPLVPPGEYLLMLETWSTTVMWGRCAKLIMTFTIVDVGSFHGLRIQRYYNIKKLVGKPGKNGDFKVAWNSDLVREYANLCGLPTRLDRIYLGRLSRVIIAGRVRTVEKTAEQEDWPDPLKYSVVEKLLRIEAGHT